MPLKRNKLLDSLDELRDQLSGIKNSDNEITKLICSDEILQEIALKKPLKISDFLAISGINKSFVDNYGTAFLKVIKTHQNKQANEVKVSKEAFKVLDHYKDRLSNISRRNKNLYMGKIVKKNNFDMATLVSSLEIIDFITNKNKTVFNFSFPNTQKGDNLEKRIITLYRETNKAFKETGAYDLYLAYPFIEGIFKRESFAIRAPLLFFPVKLKRTKRTFSLVKDKDKDIVFNRDLLLATSKMEKNKIIANAPYINAFNKKVLMETVIPYYKDNGINIKNGDISYTFKEYDNVLKDTFIKRKKGVFSLNEYLILGRYKLYSSFIQKDMNKILNTNKYNELLEGLIDESNLYSKEKHSSFKETKDGVDETKLSYINEINFSQEKVINLVTKEKKLVVWGPPGTGKSQTITNLIAASVMKGENVLVVSEKKVALDVIYSRLRSASKYTMFIDDAENKQDFYYKLNNFVNPSPPRRTLNNDIYRLEEEIETILKTMNQSLKLLYNQKIEDVPIHELYSRYVTDKAIIKELSPKRVHQMFQNTFKKIAFNELKQLEKTFDKASNLKDYLGYNKIVKTYPIIKKLELKITRSNKIEFQEFNDDYLALVESLNKSWIFKRRKLKKAFLNDNKLRLKFLTKKARTDKKYLKLLLKNKELHQYLFDNVAKISKIKTKYQQLSKKEIIFVEMLQHHHLVKDIPNISKYRHYLFDAFYTGYLEEFKTKNQKYLYIIDKYEEKVKTLNALISEKQQITIESFEMELYKHALNFSNSKRIMDIKRILEGTRRMSVKAFIDIFQLELLNNVRIWMMTPEVVSAVIPLNYGMFDLVIFDEASQMYVEKGIPAIYRAKKVVIAGDTKQLRPSSLGIGRLEEEDEYYENEGLKDISMDAKSLLDLARYKYDETILNYHYRSKYEELIAFSNHAFYEGKLIVSPNVSLSKKPPIEYIYVKNGIFENRRNLQEATAVIKLIKKVFRERENNETIGVITFNSSQRDLIENYIDEELFKKSRYQKQFTTELFRNDNGEDTSLFVKNIENVQGDERDIIIFSMGYAKNNDGVIARRFGWLNNEGGQNRLNVAISRAKKKIYFVSSLYPEELKVDDLKSEGPKLLKNYMRYCYYVSNNQVDRAKAVLEQLSSLENDQKNNQLSSLVESIKKKLESNNFTVETALGIGNYKIDLAIYDEENATFKLGIICDFDDYLTLDARRDLLHQEKYLQARNWKIYRIFASNWYANPQKEMKRIKEILKK